jgi:hypothetical protein
MSKRATSKFVGSLQISLHTDPASYATASIRCQADGLQLATMTSATDMTSMASDMVTLLQAAGTPPVAMTTSGMVRACSLSR